MSGQHIDRWVYIPIPLDGSDGILFKSMDFDTPAKYALNMVIKYLNRTGEYKGCKVADVSYEVFIEDGHAYLNVGVHLVRYPRKALGAKDYKEIFSHE